MEPCFLYTKEDEADKIVCKTNVTLNKYLKCLAINSFLSLDFARVDDVEGIESLRWEDQQKIRKYVESGAGSNTSTSTGTSTSSTANNAKLEYGIEVSQTSRAGCRKCSEKILKGEVNCCSTSSVMVVAFYMNWFDMH